MFLLTTFKINTSELKKLINIKSYLRKGRLVKQSNRNIKLISKLKNTKLTKEQILKETKLLSKPTKDFKINYFNTKYENRLNSLQKEDIRSWNKQINNMNIKQVDLTDWDDSKSVMEYITEDIKHNPTHFRSITHNGKTMAMATVEPDKINKCLKVKNLLSNPERLISKDKPSGAGVTSILHMIEESMELGYEGKLKLTALPKASKFYEKLGFNRVGSEYNFSYVLEPHKAQELLDNHFNNNFSNKNNIAEAYELEKNIVVFAIDR